MDWGEGGWSWRFHRSHVKAPVDLDVSSEGRHFRVTNCPSYLTAHAPRPQYPSSLAVLPCYSFLRQINSYYSVINAALNRGETIFTVPLVASSTYSAVFSLAVNKQPDGQKETLRLTVHPDTQTSSKLQNWFLAAEVTDSQRRIWVLSKSKASGLQCHLVHPLTGTVYPRLLRLVRADSSGSEALNS